MGAAGAELDDLAHCRGGGAEGVGTARAVGGAQVSPAVVDEVPGTMPIATASQHLAGARVKGDVDIGHVRFRAHRDRGGVRGPEVSWRIAKVLLGKEGCHGRYGSCSTRSGSAMRRIGSFGEVARSSVVVPRERQTSRPAIATATRACVCEVARRCSSAPLLTSTHNCTGTQTHLSSISFGPGAIRRVPLCH